MNFNLGAMSSFPAATINTAGRADDGELHLRLSKSIDPPETDVDGSTWHVCMCVCVDGN